MRKDVRSSGWFWFISGLLVSTFIGGAVRSLLSPEQLRNWVEVYISERSLPVELHFDRIELKLADYMLPQFGVVIHDVRLESKDSCLTRSQIHVDKIYFPIEIKSLFTSELKLNYVKANKVEVLWRPSICNAKTSENSEVLEGVELLSKDKIIEEGLASFLPYQKGFSTFMMERWEKEVVNTEKWIEGLMISELQVYRQDQTKSFLLFSMSSLFFDLYPEEKHLEVQGKAQFFPLSIWKDNFGQMEFSFHIRPKKYSLDLLGWYKEGTVKVHAEGMAEDNVIRLKADLKDLPVNSMLEVLDEFELVHSPKDLSFFWLNCNVGAQVNMSASPKVDLKLDKCKASGDEGSVVLETASYDPERNLFHDLVIKFEKTKIRNMIKMLETPFLSDFNDKLAELTGTLNMKSWSDMLFSGEISRYPVQQFWHGIKWVKEIDKLPIEVVISKDRASTISRGIVIDGRVVKGFVSSNFDRQMDKGILQVRIDELLYGTEKEESVQVFGQVTFAEGKIFSWRGYLGALKMSGPGWTADRVKVSGRFLKGIVGGQWRIHKVNFNSDHKWYSLLKPLFLRHKDLGEKLTFNKTKFRFQLTEDGLTWDKLQAHSDVGNSRFYSTGEMESKELKGNILVRFPQLKTLIWNLTGTEDQLVLQPSADMLKELARESRQKKSPTGFGQLNQLDFLKSFMQREIENLKRFGQQIGKKVISRAEEEPTKAQPKNSAPKNPESKEPKSKKAPVPANF